MSHGSSDLLRVLRACVATLALTTVPALAATDSAPARIAEAQFRAANPCPTTGNAQGACTGYVIDRMIPIACGGAEHPDNMRWLTLAEAKAKARWERIGCRPGRKLVLPSERTSETEAFALDGAEPIEAAPLGTGSTVARRPARAAPVPVPVPLGSAPDAEPAAAPEEENWPHE